MVGLALSEKDANKRSRPSRRPLEILNPAPSRSASAVIDRTPKVYRFPSAAQIYGL